MSYDDAIKQNTKIAKDEERDLSTVNKLLKKALREKSPNQEYINTLKEQARDAEKRVQKAWAEVRHYENLKKKSKN